MFMEDKPTGGLILDSADAHERRSGPRHVKVLKVAKLLFGAREELCIVRDISSGGLKAEVYYPLGVNDRVTIELTEGNPVPGHVVWRADDLIGVSFDRPVSVISIIAHRTLDRLGRKTRSPRLKADFTAAILSGSGERQVQVRDVSQAGFKALADRPFPLGALCEVRLPGLNLRRAFVRWNREGHCGFQFALPMTYPEFVGWRRQLAGYEGHPG
ncbi:MAG: hypothetical protein DI623_14995 [Sphingomonas sanxanigenens]|uniref:PilZ domain-containing protein n=1 Tax=Sphingomonas sanxanigenens TaxID=397260 RepID=A0A2W5BW31_9SPHN|nr:MAG: hypothetical protein DI623_14995 [Sphingomonas sanxanigenens]